MKTVIAALLAAALAGAAAQSGTATPPCHSFGVDKVRRAPGGAAWRRGDVIGACVTVCRAPPQLETPCYNLLSNTTTPYGLTFEVREYGVDAAVSAPRARWRRCDVGSRMAAPPQYPQAWTQVSIGNTTFDNAEQEGFQANFGFISGDNSASKKIPMTAPVLMRANGSAGWLNSFFVPASLFPAGTPVPSSPALEIIGVKSLKVATTEFPGFATYQEFVATGQKLRDAVTAAGLTVVADAFEQVFAQYDSPFTLFNRHNEVWMHIA